MKKLLLSISVILLIFTGCEETQSFSQGESYKGGPIRVDEGVYFKKVYIQGLYALLQCDENGNIIKNQNTTNIKYTYGKSQIYTSVLRPDATTDETNAKFTFKCNEIEDCYNKITIVKNALDK